MKFALFTTNLAGGGAEKALAKIGSGLAARGHEVDFIVCEDAGHHPPPAGCRFTALAARAGHGWLGKRRLAWKLETRAGGELRPDLLVSTLPFADEVAALARAPQPCLPHRQYALCRDRAPAGVQGHTPRLERYRTLYGGAAAGRRLTAAWPRTLPATSASMHKRIRTIANPFDFAAIRALAAEPCPLRPAEPYLLHVGRFAAQKRHDLLLDAFARLGDGSHRAGAADPTRRQHWPR
jgi:glycosyltransferase involved in cell wall biosynthesis